MDYLIIGAGILGLSVARVLKTRSPHARIAIVEKEGAVAMHASGRNSGVLHGGIYYSSSSLKARLCLSGNRALRAFCADYRIPINDCGKFVIATSEEEIPQLETIHQRAIANGCDVAMLTKDEASRIEPNLSHVGLALFSPLSGSVDPVLVCATMRRELQDAGVTFFFETKYQEKVEGGIQTDKGFFEGEFIINCAGLYADRIAKDFGFGKDFDILPFKGLYLKYSANKTDIKTNIYPVPDPKFPFLGVHFTKTADGTIKIGPTAVPAFWRENYRGLDNFSLRECSEILSREARLFLKNSFYFRDLALIEMRKYHKPYFINLARKLVKNINLKGFGDFSTPGIRAQLLDKRTGELVQDFVVNGDAKSVHILNAVSPGFTCGLSFAQYIVENHIPG